MGSPDRKSVQLETALKRAAPSAEALDRLLASELQIDPGLFEATALDERIEKIVRAAKAEQWDHTLLDVAWKQFMSRALDQASHRVDGSQIAPHGQEPDNLQAIHPPASLGAWRDDRARIERRVCRILRRDPHMDRPLGTGFLVAPSIVMTNWHVLSLLLAEVFKEPERILFQFDYTGPGVKGRFSRLAQSWFLACNPERKAKHVGVNDLDFALVRLADAPGEDQAGSARRGKIDVPRALPRGQRRLTVGEPLCIVQHPLGKPIHLAMAVHGVQALNEPARLTYRVSTDERSSGSPCFNKGWELVALHRGGAAALDANEGIPIDSIRDALPSSLRAEITGAS